MKTSIPGTALLICFLFVSGISHAQNGEKNFLDRPYMEVTGKAEMEVIPDEIYLSILIQEKDNKRKTNLAQAEKDMIQRLKTLGIDTKKQLSVKDLGSNFKNYWIKSSDILTSKSYELLVYDAQMAGKVLLALEAEGISNVQVDRVDHSKIEQLKRDVKIQAIKVAKEKANDMAEAIGQTAGKAVYIQENDYMSTPYNKRGVGLMRANVMMVDAAIEQVPEIEFEKIRLEYQVLTRFELN